MMIIKSEHSINILVFLEKIARNILILNNLWNKPEKLK